MSESALLRKGPCGDCGSSDACCTYDDGHTHCFSCQKTRAGSGGSASGAPRKPKVPQEFIQGEVSALSARRINAETCAKFNYRVGKSYSGKPVQIAHYYDKDGELVAQKLRDPDKEFPWIGESKKAALFGQQLWRDKGKRVVVTEGEIDAMSVSQLQGNKWPVVSIQNGAGNAKKSISDQLDWLLGFDEIVLMFDDDEAGRKAAKECAPLFPAKRCKIARIDGFKDANDALKAGQGAKVIAATFEAKEYRPDGIVTLKEIAQAASRPPQRGRPWFLPELDEATLGLHFGQLVLLGGGSGTGKTHVAMHQADCDLLNGFPIALHLMESDPEQSVRTLAGLRAGRNYTELTEDVDPAQLAADIAELAKGPEVHILDSQGANDWASIRDRIRHLTHANGVRIHYVDNLTTLAAGSELDEKEAVEEIVSEAAGLVVELDISIIMVSHLATPEGKPHEEGGRVMLRHFRGSRAVGYWSWIVVGLERNSQAEDDATRFATCWRILKCRPKGSSTGRTTWTTYNPHTAKLSPCEAPQSDSAKKHGFRDESQGDF